MCLDSTRQGYLLLKAFSEARGSGTDLPRLVRRMQVISNDEFGTDQFVFNPRPIISMIRTRNQDGEIQATADGTWEITQLGENNLQFLDQQYIEPVRAGLRAMAP